MRKLMIAAAAAALTAGAFAAEPQVYEMTLTVKTTACATNKKAVKTDCGDILWYRKQITRKYQGLFWGCGCQVIACPTEYFKGLQYDKEVTQPNELTSYLFWSATKGYQYGLYGLDEDSEHGDDMAFRWNLLQLVGPKAANVEGAWDLVLRGSNEDKGAVADDNPDNNIVLTVSGAGYGTAERICTENVRIKSMSGYVSGVNFAKGEIGISGCLYCGDEDECSPWQFCAVCEEDKGLQQTFDLRSAMFGSWTLKFNSSAAKKLEQSKPIESAYKFPKYLNLGNYTADDGTGEATDTVKTAAEAAYKAAKEAYEKAKADVDAAKAKQTEAADTEANLKLTTPKGTAEGVALGNAYKAAQQATQAAQEAKDATDDDVTNTKAALDTTMSTGSMKTYSNDVKTFVDKSNALDRANEKVTETQSATVGDDGDYTTEAEKNTAISNAKKDAQKAQEEFNAAKETYDQNYAKLSPSAKAESDAYKAALETQTAAQNKLTDATKAETDALQDIKDWTSGNAANKKSQAYAKAKAAADLEKLEAIANSKELIMATYRSQCIAAGGSCD